MAGLDIYHVTAGCDAITTIIVIATLGIGGYQTIMIIGVNLTTITMKGDVTFVTDLDILLHNAHKGTPIIQPIGIGEIKTNHLPAINLARKTNG